MRVTKKASKRTMKKLHGAIKGILERESTEPIVDVRNKERKDEEDYSKRPLFSDITEAVEREQCPRVPKKGPPRAMLYKDSEAIEERNGVLYIMSKENQLIPKLTDDEVMKLHKKADENMKQIWTSIIDKYEAVEDQGDVIDLHTGELVEDNGHIRGISGQSNKDRRYRSSLEGLIDIEEKDDDDYNIWQDEGGEDGDDDEDIEYIEESSSSDLENNL